MEAGEETEEVISPRRINAVLSISTFNLEGSGFCGLQGLKIPTIHKVLWVKFSLFQPLHFFYGAEEYFRMPNPGYGRILEMLKSS